MNIDDVKKAIRDVPDFPKKGIIFKDITPVLNDAKLFKTVIDAFVNKYKDKGLTRVAAIDARGFLFGGAIADRLGIGCVPIRKKGKLPYKTFEESYDLEYGSATLTIHQDAFKKGDKVLLVDDLLATGGTAAASANLIKKAGGHVAGLAFLVELAFLKGRDKLSGYDIYVPIVF